MADAKDIPRITRMLYVNVRALELPNYRIYVSPAFLSSTLRIRTPQEE